MDNRVQSYIVNQFDNFSPEEKQQLFYALKHFPEKVAQQIYEDLPEWVSKASFKNVDPSFFNRDQIIKYSQELTELLINYFAKEIQSLELEGGKQ